MAMMDKALETVEYGKFTKRVFSVSYTHLDVYKRQAVDSVKS